MALLNSIVITVVFILVYNGKLLFSLIGLFLTAILLIGTIYMFVKRDQYYIYFCYGLTLCGVINTFFPILINVFFLIILIPQGIYIYSIIDYNIFNESLTYRSAYSTHLLTGISPDTMNLPKKTQTQKLEESQTKKIEKKFKFNSIAIVSFCCSIGIILSLIFSV